VKLTRLEQLANARFPIEVTPFPIVIVGMPANLNASPPIVVTLLGMEIGPKERQFLNAKAPMLVRVAPAEKVTVNRLKQPWNVPSGTVNAVPHVTVFKELQLKNA
jgi:hypothetical protein